MSVLARAAHDGALGNAGSRGLVGSDAGKRLRFRDTAVTLKRRIDLMLSLPIKSLDSIAIQREIKDIGTR